MRSPLENFASVRSRNVYVSPSAGSVGGPTAMSGSSCSSLSNLYRPEKTLRRMSTSGGLETRAGSKSAMSWAMGKLSVWSAASGSGEGGGLLFGLQPTTARTTAISQARARIGGRLTGGATRADRPPGFGLDLESPQFPLSRRSSAWLEQRSFKPRVRGSSPRAGTNFVAAATFHTFRAERAEKRAGIGSIGQKGAESTSSRGPPK